jgi:hypothetical protein
MEVGSQTKKEMRSVKLFPFEHIPDAHRLMAANDADGKIVVVGYSGTQKY